MNNEPVLRTRVRQGDDRVKELLQIVRELKVQEQLEIREVVKAVETITSVVTEQEKQQDNIKLRNLLVWFLIVAYIGDIILIVLHSKGWMVLPNSTVIAISAMMGGSTLGLGGLLYLIGKDLYPGANKKR